MVARSVCWSKHSGFWKDPSGTQSWSPSTCRPLGMAKLGGISELQAFKVLLKYLLYLPKSDAKISPERLEFFHLWASSPGFQPQVGLPGAHKHLVLLTTKPATQRDLVKNEVCLQGLPSATFEVKLGTPLPVGFLMEKKPNYIWKWLKIWKKYGFKVQTMSDLFS